MGEVAASVHTTLLVEAAYPAEGVVVVSLLEVVKEGERVELEVPSPSLSLFEALKVLAGSAAELMLTTVAFGR